jgi:hypothetical protein
MKQSVIMDLEMLPGHCKEIRGIGVAFVMIVKIPIFLKFSLDNLIKIDIFLLRA